MAMCLWHFSAVPLRRGSTHTSLALARFAGAASAQQGDLQVLGLRTHAPIWRLRADALQRPQDAIRVVRALDVARNLGAEGTVRRRVVRVAVDADRLAVVDGDEHRAGVGAVVWTGGADNGRDHLQTMAYPCSGPVP